MWLVIRLTQTVGVVLGRSIGGNKADCLMDTLSVSIKAFSGEKVADHTCRLAHYLSWDHDTELGSAV